MNTMKVQIAKGYDMRIGDLGYFEMVFRERGLAEALYAAYKAGWKRHESMTRNNVKSGKKAV